MSASTVKCLSCGANIGFDIKTQSCLCKYFHTYDTIEQIEAANPEENSSAAWENIHQQTQSAQESGYSVHNETGAAFDEDMQEYSCPSCGAKVVMQKSEAAAFCVFCRNHVIVPQKLGANAEAPKRLLSFKKTKEDAKAAFLKLCKKNIFAPKHFKKPKNIESLRSVYVPYWLYSSLCSGSMEFDCRKVTAWSSGKYRYTKTDIFRARRAGSMKFSEVPIDASKALPDKEMQGIEPFNLGELAPFSKNYISGHYAKTPDVPLQTMDNSNYSRVKTMMEETISETVVGYTSVSPLGASCALNGVVSEYVMLPVWMLVNKYNGKTYLFVMNGQTGEIVGNVPYSWRRVLVWFLGIFVGLIPITYAWFQWGSV